VFTPERRKQVRSDLVARARADERLTGAAITGSAARDAEDRWSDIDLFLGVAAGVPVEVALTDWSDFVRRELGAIHHFDLRAGPAVYRAFLLDDALEVDLGFAPASAFGPVGDGGFRLVFGDAAARVPAGLPDAGHLIGLAWHHVLHARVSIERCALWQAEHWIGAVRDHTITLACRRLGLPSAYAKGADALPHEITRELEEALVGALDRAELRRALRAAAAALVRELHETDPEAARVLRGPLGEMAGS
jgi:predicted nucleotidyltransferase